jgi:hypothetical protein
LLTNLIDSDFPPHHFLRFDAASMPHALRRAGFAPELVEVFQWGYSGPTLLAALSRPVRTYLRKRRDGAVAVPSAVARARPRPRVASALLNRSLARACEPVERVLGRGFKLYFVARKKV